MAGAIIMMVTYGHQVASSDDEFVAIAEAVREQNEQHPGNSLVDLFPVREFSVYRRMHHVTTYHRVTTSEVSARLVPWGRLPEEGGVRAPTVI